MDITKFSMLFTRILLRFIEIKYIKGNLTIFLGKDSVVF